MFVDVYINFQFLSPFSSNKINSLNEKYFMQLLQQTTLPIMKHWATKKTIEFNVSPKHLNKYSLKDFSNFHIQFISNPITSQTLLKCH